MKSPALFLLVISGATFKLDTMSAKQSADHLLLLVIIGLTLFGFIMVASASSVVGERFKKTLGSLLNIRCCMAGPWAW